MQPKFALLKIPRAHQPLLFVLLTTLKSFLGCVHVVLICPFSQKITYGKPFVDLLIMNGPETCVPFCAATMLSRVGCFCAHET